MKRLLNYPDSRFKWDDYKGSKSMQILMDHYGESWALKDASKQPSKTEEESLQNNADMILNVIAQSNGECTYDKEIARGKRCLDGLYMQYRWLNLAILVHYNLVPDARIFRGLSVSLSSTAQEPPLPYGYNQRIHRNPDPYWALMNLQKQWPLMNPSEQVVGLLLNVELAIAYWMFYGNEEADPRLSDESLLEDVTVILHEMLYDMILYAKLRELYSIVAALPGGIKRYAIPYPSDNEGYRNEFKRVIAQRVTRPGEYSIYLRQSNGIKTSNPIIVIDKLRPPKQTSWYMYDAPRKSDIYDLDRTFHDVREFFAMKYYCMSCARFNWHELALMTKKSLNFELLVFKDRMPIFVIFMGGCIIVQKNRIYQSPDIHYMLCLWIHIVLTECRGVWIDITQTFDLSDAFLQLPLLKING